MARKGSEGTWAQGIKSGARSLSRVQHFFAGKRGSKAACNHLIIRVRPGIEESPLKRCKTCQGLFKLNGWGGARPGAGRPSLDPGVRLIPFSLGLPPKMLSDLDAWRKRYELSRTEAIREMILRGLRSS